MPDALELGAGNTCIGIIGEDAAAAFWTLTVTGAEVAELGLPMKSSVAMAVSLWEPLAILVLSQLTLKGEALAEPTAVPSTMYWTLEIVSPSMALAMDVNITIPDTIALDAGAVTETVGAGHGVE